MADAPLWLIYLGIFFGPFVQEDTAVFTAASYSATVPNDWIKVFLIIWIGLCLSDLWKYWVGWAALRHPKARKFAEKEKVIAFHGKIKDHAFISLIGVRFMPLARVPAYVACGFFKVSYLLFSFAIILSAFLYCAVIFAICHLLGELFDDKLKIILPITAIAVIILFVSGQWLYKRLNPSITSKQH
ncbi:MAG: VTT domain-containing protein [Maricaulaceae bacterium]